jgi:hypothetical protein
MLASVCRRHPYKGVAACIRRSGEAEQNESMRPEGAKCTTDQQHGRVKIPPGTPDATDALVAITFAMIKTISTPTANCWLSSAFSGSYPFPATSGIRDNKTQLFTDSFELRKD